MSYSLDLRERVVESIRVEEMTQAAAAARYKVGLMTVKRWLKRENLSADKPGPRGSRLDVEALKRVVEEKPDAYLDEYAKMLNTSSSTVSYNLLKLGISRKKNESVRRKKRRAADRIQAGT